MSTGYIVLGHGSMVKETIGILEEITNALKVRLKLERVQHAALQFNEPDLPQAIAMLARDGVNDIVVVPLFLTDGNHMRDDIPGIIGEERAKYPGLKIRLAGHIGADPRLTDILADRVAEALDVNIAAQKAKLTDPEQIEEESFKIIESSIDLEGLGERQKAVVKRIVHASGDLSLAGTILISAGAIKAGIEAVRAGKPIITDVRMAATGISSKLAAIAGNEIGCKVNDPAVADEAKRLGKTRSAAAMRLFSADLRGGIVVIGNAPTALFELLDMVEEGVAPPALVIGTPVGFVGAAESKEALVRSGLNYITIRGTRGGSAIAAAAVNAILKMAHGK